MKSFINCTQQRLRILFTRTRVPIMYLTPSDVLITIENQSVTLPAVLQCIPLLRFHGSKDGSNSPANDLNITKTRLYESADHHLRLLGISPDIH